MCGGTGEVKEEECLWGTEETKKEAKTNIAGSLYGREKVQWTFATARSFFGSETHRLT